MRRTDRIRWNGFDRTLVVRSMTCGSERSGRIATEFIEGHRSKAQTTESESLECIRSGSTGVELKRPHRTGWSEMMSRGNERIRGAGSGRSECE